MVQPVLIGFLPLNVLTNMQVRQHTRPRSGGREKTPVSLDSHPVEARRLQRRHNRHLPKRSQGGDFIFHNDKSQPAPLPLLFQTPSQPRFHAWLGFLQPWFPASINSLSEAPKAISTCFWRTEKAIYRVKYHIDSSLGAGAR